MYLDTVSVSDIDSMLVGARLNEARVIVAMLGRDLYISYLLQSSLNWFKHRTKAEILAEEIDGQDLPLKELDMLLRFNKEELVQYLVDQFEERLDGYKTIIGVVNNFV